ncbi:MAG TPA: MBL fold metallo-hydrolase [Gaiellaceae bacterium]
MSEPKAVAQELVEVVPGILHWAIEDERIGGHISAAHAVVGGEGAVLIDPLPLAAEAMAQLGPVTAILVTAGSHQRSAWRFRRELEVPVWMPALAREIDEDPDERYGHDDVLPGDLLALFTPGAGTTQHTLLLDDRAAFVPDLLLRPPGGELALVPAEYMYDPDQARQSLERLVDEHVFDVLCLSHGVPVTEDPEAAIRAALAG